MPHRTVSLTSKKYQSSKPGEIITSKRKFGVEFEVLHPKIEAIQAIEQELDKSFGLHHDGTIQGSGHGIEVVTPILAGEKGEGCVHTTLLTLSALDFETNLSCGLHVHLDGDKFLPNEESLVIVYDGSVSGVQFYQKSLEIQSGGNPVMHHGILVQNKLFTNLKKRLKSTNEIYHFLTSNRIKQLHTSGLTLCEATIGNDSVRFFRSLNGYYTFLDKSEFDSLRKIKDQLESLKLSRYSVVVGALRHQIDGEDTVVDLHNKLVSKDLTILKEGDVYLFPNDNNIQFRHLQALMYFYTAFGDVFLSMLPEDRRMNHLYSPRHRSYCEKLSQRLAPRDIEMCGSFQDLERLWFKVRGERTLQMKKGDHYDESRYYGVNFHSLFAKYKTVEIRWHEATLNPESVLFWIATHQHILDNVASGDIELGEIRDIFNIFKLEKKIEYFFELCQFPPAIEKYLRRRIEFFNN